MASKSMARPAGMPSRIITSEGPCDSPAVRNRSIERSFYPKNLRTLERGPRASRTKSAGVDLALLDGDTREGFVDLVADRFLVCDQESTIDLATGDRVELVVSASGGVAEQARWATRCERLRRLHHRSIARLLDYGPFGEADDSKRGGAMVAWRGSQHESECVRRQVEDVFPGKRVERYVRPRRCPAIERPCDCSSVPDSRLRGGRPIAADRVGEVRLHRFESGPHGSESRRASRRLRRSSAILRQRCRAVALCGSPGSGPRYSGDEFRKSRSPERLCAGQCRGCFSQACTPSWNGVRWRCSFDRTSHWAGGHCCTSRSLEKGSHRPVCRREPTARCPRSHDGTHRAPGARGGRAAATSVVLDFARRITAAARRARGLPGRFEALVWGERDMQQSLDGTKPSRVAEPALQYGQETAPAIPTDRGGRVVEWPAPGELSVARKRLQTAIALAGRASCGRRPRTATAGCLACAPPRLGARSLGESGPRHVARSARPFARGAIGARRGT